MKFMKGLFLFMFSCFLLISAEAYSCLLVEYWKEIPTLKTVELTDEIYLANFQRLDPINSHQVKVIMEVVETIKGQERSGLKIITETVSAVHKSDRHVDHDHQDTKFWSGEQSNTRLMGDCSYAPVEYYDEGTYLILMASGRLHTAVSFERIRDQSNDLWFRFVECVASHMDTDSIVDTDHCLRPQARASEGAR